MRHIKYWVLLASLVLVACSDEKGNSDLQGSKAQQASSCTIIYGWESRKPYQFYENKRMQGIDIDIIQQANEQTGCKLEFVQKSWAELLDAIEKGSIDLIGGATPTDERKAFADFSVPYREEAWALFISADSRFNGDNLNQFLSHGNKVGTSTGYYYGEEVDNLMNHPQYSSSFVGSTTNEASFFNVEYGRVDGVLVDPIEGRYIIKRKGLSAKMKESKIVLPADSVTYMFSKKSTKQDKLAQIKAAVEQLVANNKPQEIITKYQ